MDCRRHRQRERRGREADGVGGEEEAGRGEEVVWHGEEAVWLGEGDSGVTVGLGGALELLPLLFVGILVATEDLGVCLIVAEFFLKIFIRARGTSSSQSLAAGDQSGHSRPWPKLADLTGPRRW